MLDTTADAPQSLQLLFQLPNVQGDSQCQATMATMPTQNPANPVSKSKGKCSNIWIESIDFSYPPLASTSEVV